MCISNKVSGIVLCSKYVQTEKFHSLHIPVISFEREEENSSAVTIQCDNYQGGKIAANHLIEQGCKKLLHFGGVRGKDMPADRRADGFIEACREKGVQGTIMVSNQLVYGSMHYQEYIQEGLEKFPDVDGIFASSDLIAAQVIQICNQMGIHIPEK